MTIDAKANIETVIEWNEFKIGHHLNAIVILVDIEFILQRWQSTRLPCAAKQVRIV